jgi:hypothetical protein
MTWQKLGRRRFVAGSLYGHARRLRRPGTHGFRRSVAGSMGQLYSRGYFKVRLERFVRSRS